MKKNSSSNSNFPNVFSKVTFYSFSEGDALSHLRVIAPMHHLGVQVFNGVEDHQVYAERAIEGDLIVMQRDLPRDLEAYKQIMETARNAGKKIVFDLDDLLVFLPKDHPDRLSHLYTEALLPILQAITEVDLVTVSSQNLYDFLKPLNQNIRVLPNYFDDAIWQFRQPVSDKPQEDPITIAYMGSHSHRPDIELVLPVLVDIAKKYNGRVRFHFWGLEPPKPLKTTRYTEWTSTRSHRYLDFAADFQKLQPDIFIAPLVDNFFNRCKSEVKFLEYSALGAPGVYSNLPPYSSVIEHGVNGLLAGSLNEWQENLEILIQDAPLRGKLASQAQSSIQQNWLMSENCQQWADAYQAVIETIGIRSDAKIPFEILSPLADQLFELHTDQRNQLDKLSFALTEQKQKETLFQKQEDALKTKFNVAEDQIAEQTRKINELKCDLENFANKFQKNNELIKLQQAQIHDLNILVSDKEDQLDEREQSISALTSQTLLLEEAIQDLTGEVSEKKKKVSELLAQVQEQKNIITVLSEDLHTTRFELNEIKISKAWRVGLFFRNVRMKIMPPNSSRSSWLIKKAKKLLHPFRALNSHRQLKRDIDLVNKSGLFDVAYYKENNPDVAIAYADPLVHYLQFGGFEGRDPCPQFSSANYLITNDDVRQAHINPLVHYIRFGRTEGRDPKGVIDPLPAADTSSIEDLESEVSSEVGQDENRTSKRIIIDDLYSQAYQEMVRAAESNRNGDYVPLDETQPDLVDPLVKLIAFYLPQFHPFPENDLWWGKGFTEWTNVSKAIPQFEGHYQPRLPGELGFYDLRLYDVQQRQIELARKFGIYGFCFHYYWFSGKRLLERPLDQFLLHPENAFPFCICWANENWTRRWDGQEEDVLIAQEHTLENDKNFIADLAPILHDKRYIHVNDRPLIIIYRPSLIKRPIHTAEYWREYCLKQGLGNPMLVAAQTFGFSDPKPIGFDAAVEFPPHNILYRNIKHKMKMLNINHTGSIYDYREMVQKNIIPLDDKYRVFRTVTPSWDNEARKPGRGNSFVFSTPPLYKRWLEQVCLEEIIKNPDDEKVVFINAWNEWGESAYLEPDRRYGYAYLQATKNGVQDAAKYGFLLKDGSKINQPVRKHDIAVIMHIYYKELLKELIDYVSNLQEKCDVFVSLSQSVKEFSANIFKAFPSAHLLLTENKGRDIAPFINIYRVIGKMGYTAILKLHTKKSIHREDGDAWRNDMLQKLSGSPEVVKSILEYLANNSQIGMIGPKGHVLDHRVYWGFNKDRTLQLARDTGILFSGDPEFNFIAGSMFWAKPQALTRLYSLPVGFSDFEAEPTPPDGALAHAVERYLGLACQSSGYEIHEIDHDGKILPPGKDNLYAFAVPYPG